jgi:hypothetical protein
VESCIKQAWVAGDLLGRGVSGMIAEFLVGDGALLRSVAVWKSYMGVWGSGVGMVRVRCIIVYVQPDGGVGSSWFGAEGPVGA